MTIAGMAFNLSFARLGMMYDGRCRSGGRIEGGGCRRVCDVILRTARLKLSDPDIQRGNTGEKVDKVNQNVFANDGAKADTLRNAYKKTYKPTGSSSGSLTKNNKKTKVANNQNNKKEGDDDGDTDAKVEVKNVLYGMNQGFIGVNFSAEVKIPGYTDSMPNIEGTLEVNTVNDWSMGVEGSASFLKPSRWRSNWG